MAKSEQKTKQLRLILVGGETLLGKELADVLTHRKKGTAITSFAATGEGNFSEQEGEAVYLEPLKAETLAGEDALLVAGTAEGAQKAYQLAKMAGGQPAVIDCTGLLEHEPEAHIVSHQVLGIEPPSAPGVKDHHWLFVIAHPAATAIALTLERLAKYKPIRQASAHVFEPASERGQRGISELHQQTTGLLAFKPLEKKIYDAQLSFNLLAQYGEEAPQRLAEIEQRIERHLATLLHSRNKTAIPMPSLRLMQAPVFHGYSVSLWVEFDSDVRAGEIGEALASAQIDVRMEGETTPDNVSAAGQSGLMAGDIRIDRNNPRAAWLWLAADNFRLTADAAADLVGDLMADAQ